MLLPVENALAALKDEVRADRVLDSIEGLVEGLLLGEQDNGAVVSHLACRHLSVLLHRPLDVAPDVRRVVPVQVDYSLRLLSGQG